MPAPLADVPKKRILFVDDEPLILNGLQRMLRPQRKDWDMTFVNSGEEALAALARTPFDVIVTDMRMPVMDGAALLEKVKERCPMVIRIVLSGYFERETALRAVPVAHQFLAKPCDALKLREVIERCCGFAQYVRDDATKRVVGAIGELPSLPRNCASLLKALDDAETPVSDIAKIVEHDVGISIKVLQLANSAFFGPSYEVTSIRAAVGYLGLEVLKTLVVSAEIFGSFQLSHHAPGFSFEGFEAHSLLSARLAARMPLEKDVAATAAVAALLHDTGMLVLSARLPEQFGAALSVALKEKRALYRVEAELNGTTHAEVGAYLLGLWGLPQRIVEATGYHNRCGATEQKGQCLDAVSAVQIANILALEHQQPGHGEYPLDHDNLEPEYLSALGVTNQIADWRAMAEEIATAPTEV